MRRLVAPVALLALAGCGTTPHATPTTHTSSGSATGSAARSTPQTPPTPARLHVKLARFRLPAPIAREAVTGSGPVVTVAGGLLDGDGSTAAAYTLDLRTGTSTPLPSMRVPVHDTAGAVAGGDPLVIGGGNASEQDVVQRWDGSAWSTIGHLPSPRSDLSVVSVGGRVIVLGGFNGTRPAEPDILASTDGVSWQVIGQLPVPVRYAAVAVLAGKILLFGGEVAGVMQTAIQEVDPVTGRAHVVGHLSGPLGHASAVVAGGRVLVVGGRTGVDTITDRMWWFDASDRSVSRAGRLPRPLSDAAVATYGGWSWLLGGESPNDVSTVVRLRLS